MALIEDRTGQSLGGRYTIRELLGIGGQGVTVWEAWQEDAERRVAVKLLPLDDAGRDHFLDASGKASVLDHPNVVRLFDFNKTEDGLACGVMELIEGRPLSVELSDGQAMPVDEALHIVQQVLAGLEHAHENGVLHLDIKPGNVFLMPAGDEDEGPQVKLVDFGLVEPRPVAQRFAGPIASSDEPSESLQYTAPELLASGRAGPQSDLYSVGALLFRLMSGRPPFPFDSATEIARGHLTHAPPSPFSIRPIGEMPSALPEILEQALDKAPARRFASAAAMLDAIDAALRGETLIDVLDEATVARVSVADLMMPPHGLESAKDLKSTPATPSPPPAVEDDGASRNPAIIAVIVIALTIALLIWTQFFRQPAPAPAPTPPAPAPAAPATPAPATPAPTAPAAPAPAKPAPAEAAPAEAAPTEAAPAEPAPAEPAPAAAQPAEPAPAEPAIRAFRLGGEPAGAEVLLGDEVLGTLPLEHSLPLGTHALRIRKRGFTSQEVELTLAAGDTAVEQSVELKRVRRRPAAPANPTPPPAAPAAAEPDAAVPAPDAAAPAAAPDAAAPKPAKPKIQVLGNPGQPAPSPAGGSETPAAQPHDGIKPLGSE